MAYLRTILLLLLAASAGDVCRAQLPVAGIPIPSLAIIDSTVQEFMQANNVSAGVVAVMKNGVPIYNRTFGWKDQAKTIPLPPNAIMRLASVTKPLTAAAVRRLSRQGAFDLDSRVFSLDEPGSGLLDNLPFGGTFDPRLKDVTVSHLLQHRGGWDRNIAGDHTFRERTIANAMGVPSPPGKELTLDWVLGQPLQFAPGSGSSYSNLGYMVLGMIAEKYAGKPLIDYLRQDVFLGVTSPDYLVASRTFAADHDPREPYYDSNGQVSTNVYWPTYSPQALVPRAYGGYDVESRIGQGGISADPLAILSFLNRFQIAGNNIGGSRPGPGNWTWSHTGGNAGISTVATQRGDGINFVAMFNKSDASIGGTLNSLFNSGQITDWPTENVAAIPEVPGDFNLDGMVDGNDFLVWQRQFSVAVRAGTGADGNGDGIVDENDLIVWKNSFGQVAAKTTAAVSNATVPEPGTLLLAATPATLLVLQARSRRRTIRRKVFGIGSVQRRDGGPSASASKRRQTRPFALTMLVALGIVCIGFENSDAATALLFDGGNGASQVDQYAGAIGEGWDTAWSRSSGASGTTAVTATNPLSPDGGNYLRVDLTGVDRNVIRQYGNTVDFDVNSEHTISWQWRMDEPWANMGSSVNNRVNFFANPTLTNASTTATNTWTIGVAPNVMGHDNWYFYDRVDANTSGLTAVNSVNTGIPLVQGTTYQFSVTVDPLNFKYSATVSDGVSSFTRDDLRFRSETLNSSYLHFGIKSANSSASHEFSLDSVVITGGSPPTNELPTMDGFRGIWYWNQNVGAPHNYKYSGGLGTYTQQLRPFAYYAAEADKTFFVYGGTNDQNTNLFHMVSYFDHQTGQVARPRLLLAKGTTDAHDNPTIMLDDDGYIFVFSPSHGTAREAYISRSTEPYSIDSFERVLTLPSNNNFSYSQPLYVPGQGFMFMHTQYTGAGRTLKFNRSTDGVNWDFAWNARPTIVNIPGGQYQISETHEQTVGTAFNWHPNGVVNDRTNLYYMQTTDMGNTWTTAAGVVLTTPVTTVTNAALVRNYASEGLRVYLKDINYDAAGQPVLLYLTTTQWEPGPLAEGERTWHIAHYKNDAWQFRDIFTSDHNYDFGSLYIEDDGMWRIIAPTEPGPQPYGTGGDMVMWQSQDEGVTWEATKQLTHGSELDHAYARRPVNANDEFYAFWADGNPLAPSESRFYYTDREGTGVWQLPWSMDGADFAAPEKAYDPLLLVQPADFDDNGVVDDGDLAVWRAGFGAMGDATRLQGDANGDRNVDGADFLIWQRSLGKSADLPFGSSEPAPTPEPTSMSLFSFGLLLAAQMRTLQRGRVRRASRRRTRTHGLTALV